MNCAVADPTLLVSPKHAEKGANAFAAKATDTPHDQDLVARLIHDNQHLWKQLLNNPFCKKMKTAPKDDQDVLEGFKRYMIQDYLYCKKLPEYEKARRCQTSDPVEIKESEERIKKASGYADVILKTCTDQPTCGLGIERSTVEGAMESSALKSYTGFQISTAESTDWVLSLVAMIPCIQSYYQIAVDLRDSSAHKDTAWYNLWVLENAKYEGSTIRQRTFFIEKSDRWRSRYEEANDIFRKACQGEIDFWAMALGHEA